MMTFNRQDPLTGEINTMVVNCTPQQYKAYKDGKLIQEAMPDATPDQREFLLTGLTPESWAKLFVDPLYGPE